MKVWQIFCLPKIFYKIRYDVGFAFPKSPPPLYFTKQFYPTLRKSKNSVKGIIKDDIIIFFA